MHAGANSRHTVRVETEGSSAGFSFRLALADQEHMLDSPKHEDLEAFCAPSWSARSTHTATDRSLVEASGCEYKLRERRPSARDKYHVHQANG
jgi:hypothetical protein